MAFATISRWIGWSHIVGRTRAWLQVTAGPGGDVTTGGTNSDAQGVAWVQVTVQLPYEGSVAMVVGTPLAQVVRAVQVVASVAGNVSILMKDGSSNVVPVVVGMTVLPYAALGINTSGTTATASYTGLL